MYDTHPLRSFREKNVQIFFGGLAISGVGTWAQTTAVVLLVRDLGGGGVELGIVTACQFLPMLLLGLYAGAVADRRDRHRMTIGLQALMGLQALTLGFIDLFDAESLPTVYSMTAVFGVLAAFDNPARRTLATELVPATELTNILALSTSVMTGARMFGPALAAVFAGLIGTAWVFLLNGITFVAFLAAMFAMDTNRFHRIKPAPRSPTPIRDGLHEVWAVPQLRIAVVVFGVVSTFAYNYLVGFPLLIAERLQSDDAMFGWLLSTMSAGNVIGSLLIARLRFVTERWMYGAATGIAVTLAIISLSTSVPLTFAFAFPLGMCTTAFVNASTLIIQQGTNPQTRSRVLALTSVLFLGSTPIGGPITGVIGDTAGAVWATLYGAIITALAVVVGLLALRHVGKTPPGQTATP